MTDRTEGVTKFFNADKGYGFILPTNGGPDVFVHMKDLRATGIAKLQQAQRVSFEIISGREGKPKAVNVALL